MKTLGEVTLEQFLKIAKEEGITNDSKVREYWRNRPKQAPFDEALLRMLLSHFKPNINQI